MSAKDLSILSYKELQALAVKHRVPGNIKKLLLVKILHAVKCGNSSEVTRLLTDLKKNRKKRTKRIKIMKTDEDGSVQIAIHNDSPDLPSQQDHYLFPIQQQHQHQYPFQWVGAEEEVGTSKYEDLRCNLSYNDIRQLVLYTSHGVYGNCDTNNNSTLLDEIIDLRTEATVSNYRTNMETNHINNTSQQQQLIQPAADESASKKMSLLLKKMLQAPAGANLGEIASPVETWAIDTYRLRGQSPDNSETMTAKSDINENDEIWQDNVTVPATVLPCVFENDQNYTDNSFYRRNNNITTYYRSSLDNNGEQNSLQGYEQQQQQACNPYQFNFVTQTDAQENCRSWLASNSLGISNAVEYGTTSTSRLEPASSIQYQSPESTDMINPSSGDASNIVQTNTQYCLTADQLYSSQGSHNILESSELVSDLQFDTSRYYQTPSSIVRPSEPQTYYRQVCATEDTPSFNQDLYETHQQQSQQQQHQQHPPPQQSQLQQPNEHQSRYPNYVQQLTVATEATPIYHVELDNTTYDPGYYQEHQQNVVPNHPTITPLGADSLQQVQHQQFENYVVAPGPSTVQNNLSTTYGSAVLDPYWPRWSYTDRSNVNSTMNGRSLENTLNLCATNYVDYAKLNETCCVYSNKTPVMTLRKGLNSVPSLLESRIASGGCSSTEYRQHNFASNWLLYNDEVGSDLTSKSKDFTQTTLASLSGYCSVEQRSDNII